MIITHHREKLINAIIYFAKNTQYCGKTKLLKLLYFLDFRHFKQMGKPVTGLDYYAWDMGPVPRDLYNELEDMKPDLKAAIKLLSKEGFQKYIPKKKFNGEYFSKREMRLLEDISYIFKDAKANEMIESTHLANEPWSKTLKEKGKFKKIDYMLSIDNIDSSLSVKEALERKEEISETHSIFGVT
ncbi:MAG: Panacea domain-containing protein [Desulfobacterales bacterium]